MKKIILILTCLALTLALLAGCASSQGQKPSAPAAAPTTVSTTEPTTEVTAEPTQGTTEEAVVDEVEASTYYIQSVYPQQIQRYYNAISQQWDDMTCLDNGISALVARYYDGTPLDNVGFAFMDLDGDGIWELIIGAILNAERDPLVFEIWGLKDSEPVMLAQSGSHNRYYLQCADDMWTVGYEAENGAANRAVYSLKLVNGEFQVVEGVVFDALANEENPWFQTTDLDMDGSNDTPITEDAATALMSAVRSTYTATEYFPYNLYQ